MKTAAQIQNYITTFLIDDLNMLTVELNYGVARMIDDTSKCLPVIEITFKDISVSNYLDRLNEELKYFLGDQIIQLIPQYEDDTILVLLT